MSAIRLFLAVGIVILLTAGCDSKKEEPPQMKSEKVLGVRKILIHEVGRYSVFVPNTQGGYDTKSLQHCTASFFEDVPPEKEMWVEETYYMRGNDRYQPYNMPEYIRRCAFHVHSLKEISGGGWNHGKFGHGQTNVIE